MMSTSRRRADFNERARAGDGLDLPGTLLGIGQPPVVSSRRVVVK
jgi:hypothetical protein